MDSPPIDSFRTKGGAENREDRGRRKQETKIGQTKRFKQILQFRIKRQNHWIEVPYFF